MDKPRNESRAGPSGTREPARHDQRPAKSTDPHSHVTVAHDVSAIRAAAFDRLITALEDHGQRVNGGGRQRSAQCPAHEDRSPSLSITNAESRVLVRCHAGCDTDDVLAGLGLTRADLFNQTR